MGCSEQPGLMPLNEGLKKLVDLIGQNDATEVVSLDQTAGRVLAEHVFATSLVPGFDNSAMDGYAIRVGDISVGQTVPIQGKSFAGDPYRQPLREGHAVRIMTGAAMPDGADCVIMQENTETSGDNVTFKHLAEPGNNVRRAGEDIAENEQVLSQDTLLNAAHLALLASVGCERVAVYRKTKVGVLSTGDELKQPGEPLNYGDIYNSNGPAVQTMLKRLNAEVVNYGILKDDPVVFREAFLKADQECDFVITTGGVSVGEADYTKDILGEIGQIDFWKLAIKPGKPFAFGQLPNSYFIGLPGNPVSAMVTFHILASQAIRHHQRVGMKPMQQLSAVTLSDIRKVPGRMDFQRGVWRVHEGQIEVSLTRNAQGSHILSSLANANCYIALEKERGSVKTGESVTVWLFDDLI